MSDSLTRIEYILNDSLTLVQYQTEAMEPATAAQAQSSQWIAPGSLYLCGRDTVRLDSNVCGYGHVSFDNDTTWCAVAEVDNITEDGGTNTIVMYNLRSRGKVVLRKHTGGGRPLFASPGGIGALLAYSDFGDLYVYDPFYEASELLFKRGGAYAMSLCWWRRISFQWSPDGNSLVFEYSPSTLDTVKEVWEARWSRNLDSAAGE